MIIEWGSILFVVLLLFLSLLTIKIIEIKTNIKGEIKRKIFHVSMGLVTLTFPDIFKSALSVGILGIIALVLLLLLKYSKLKDGLGTILYGVNRESLGEVFFVVSVFTIFYLAKGNIVLYKVPILILTFADSSAALIGKKYGKKNIAESNEDAKSIEGSFTFFIVAFMVTLVTLLLCTTVGREETLIISAILGFNVALIEMISHMGNDNLLIPLTTYAILSTHMNMTLESLRENLIILGIIFVLVTIVNRVKSLSKVALAEIIVVGYLTITLYGIYAVVPPLMLFFTCMSFPKLKENEKKYIYNARIIETNVAIGIAICGIVEITGLRSEFFMIYGLVYSMHLTINTFIRFKYYLKLSEIKSLIFAFFKGLIFVFWPSLIIQKNVFGTLQSTMMIGIMIIALFFSGILIKIEKENVKEEEINIKNGFMHTRIVFILTIIVYTVQYFFNI